MERTLSSTPNYASCYSITTKEGSKKKKAKHMSFRVSGSSLRKRLSHKTVSPCPPAVLDRTESKRSVNSQSSDYGSTSKSEFKNDRVWTTNWIMDTRFCKSCNVASWVQSRTSALEALFISYYRLHSLKKWDLCCQSFFLMRSYISVNVHKITKWFVKNSHHILNHKNLKLRAPFRINPHWFIDTKHWYMYWLCSLFKLVLLI